MLNCVSEFDENLRQWLLPRSYKGKRGVIIWEKVGNAGLHNLIKK